MSGPSMHRAMCKKVACLECDSLETSGPETSMTERLTTFITNQFIEDFERRLFYDSTIRPGLKVTRKFEDSSGFTFKVSRPVADWDFDEFAKEWAADE